MKLVFDDVINKHRGIPCAVACHGPSLNNDKHDISALQEEGKVIRISVNEWYDFFDIKPNYWVVSNTEFTIKSSISSSHLWKQRGYPHDVFNKYAVPLLYNMTADLTEPDFIEKNLLCDYFPYDSKHFGGHRCREILSNFRNHYEKNKNLDFKFYGNNSQMWQKPDVTSVNQHCAMVHKNIGGAWSPSEKCCKYHDKERPTVQEMLQKISKHEQHVGPTQTVGIICLVFAILMGCDPIYVSGLDLDYSLGYADNKTIWGKQINIGNVGHWKYSYRDSLLDDMRILKESAANLGIRIINLNKDSWHNVFEKGELFA